MTQPTRADGRGEHRWAGWFRWAMLGGLAFAGLSMATEASARDFDASETIEWLTADEWQGRPNTEDPLNRLAGELQERIGSYGRAASEGFALDTGERLRNVYWLRAGSDTDAGWVVLGAHYDHLGRGGAEDPHRGEIYPGADDNASGVAVAMEVIERLSEFPVAERGIAVVFFAGEEVGLQGAKAFLKEGPLGSEPIVAMVNLDTVGRLSSGGLTVFGVESATAFLPTLEGVNSAHGLDLETVARSSGASDDQVFSQAGIPALHLFTGANADYHRPSDTADKVDREGLERIADFTADLVDYLAAASTRLEFVPTGATAARPDPSRASEGRRRVSFGSIPDFQFTGTGVRISGVLPGSPAAVAGLGEGDVILSFGGEEVADLTDYSEAMKLYSPGDEVEVGYLRGDQRQTVRVTLVERR